MKNSKILTKSENSDEIYDNITNPDVISVNCEVKSENGKIYDYCTDIKPIDSNDNDENNFKEKRFAKILTITSFGYSNGKPPAYMHDLVISVKNMFIVPKVVRDEYESTSKEFQTALMHITGNIDRLHEIDKQVLDHIIEPLNTHEEEVIDIFIGRGTGRQQSVAVACIIADKIRDMIETKKLIIKSNMDIDIKIHHRDFNLESLRQNKIILGQQRKSSRDKKYQYNDSIDW